MKHFLLKKHIWAVMLLTLFTTSLVAQPAWTYVNTGANHTILIQPGVVTISGNAISTGDYIGVFYNHSGTLTCAGYVQWQGSSTAISAWGTESGLNNGFANAEAFNWKVWQASTGYVIDMTATYAAGFPNAGTYSTNGMSSLATLTGTAPVIAFNASGVATNASCNSSCNGSVDLTVVGGLAPYSYTWSNGATTQDISGLCAGTYTVTVNDANFSSPVGSAFNWTFVNTGANHTVLIQPGVVTIDGNALANGDYIGVFYDQSGVKKCGGYVEWQGTSTAISAWGSESGVDNGFQNGEAFSWKVWKASTGVTIDMTATYTVGFPNLGTYSTNGMSGLTTLTGSAPVPQGNSTTATFTITQPAALALSGVLSDFSGYNVSAFGASDGSINLSVSGGTAPYTYLWSNNATTEDLTGITAGTYSVVVTGAGGCTGNAQFTLTQPAQVVNFSATGISTDVTCFNACNGAIDVTVVGGTTPYSYTWSNGATTQDLSNLCAGTYAVTVSDANYTAPSGAPFNWTFVNTGANHTILIQPGVVLVNGTEIAVGDYIGVFYDQSGVKKCGGFVQWQGSSTAISAWGSESGVDNGFQNGEAFSWKVWRASDGVTIDMTATYMVGFPNLGTYSTNGMSGLATLTGSAPVAQGNSTTLSFTINQPVALATTYTLSSYAGYNISTFGGNDGSINLTVSGGTAPYTYLWSTGAVTSSISNLIAGNYSVTVTDAHGCTNTQSFVLTEPLIIPLVIDALVTNNICFGACNGNINLSVSGGVPPYTFTWSNGAQTEDLTALCSGSYSVTIADAGVGPVAQSTVLNYSVTAPAALVSTGQVVNVICNGGNNGSIQLSVSGGVAPYVFSWSNLATVQNLNQLVAGNYSVTITDVNGCTTTNSFTLTQPEALALSATVTDLICNGNQNGAIATTVSGGVAPYIYSWSNLATTPSLTGLSGGNYSLLVTDVHGCTISNNYTVFEPTALTINMSSTNVACNGGSNGSVSATVGGGTLPYTYTWSNQAGNVSAQGNLMAGTYAVTVTDANGCMISGSAIVTEPAALAVSAVVSVFGDYNISINGAADGFIDLTVTGGTLPYTYHWSNDSIHADLFNIPAGAYAITITDAHGCVINYSTVLTQPDPAVVITASAVITNVSCNGAGNGAINQTVSGGTAPYTFTWSNGAHTEDLTTLIPGLYEVTVYDSNLDSMVTSYSVTEPAVLSLNLNQSNYNGYGVACFGGNSGYVNSIVTGGTTPYTYMWSNGAVTANLSNLYIGTYGLTVTDAHGCVVNASASLNQPYALASMSSVSNVSCFGGSNGNINFNVTAGGVSPYTFVWSNGATTSQNSNIPAGIYTVTASDANGCTVSITRTVTQPAQLVSTIGTFNNPSCFGFANGSVTVSVTGGSTPYSYLWSDENGSTTATLSGANAATYTVTVTDSHGCSTTSVQTLVNPAEMLMTSSFTDLTCNGISTGTITVNLTGGTGAYNYSWSNGATVSALTNLAAGNYTVTASDANNCQIIRPFTLAQPAAITIDSTVANVTCNGSANGTAAVVIDGGTAPYSILWANNATNTALTGLSGGTYSFVVTDANNCTLQSSVVVYEPAAIAITGTVTHIKCNNDNDGTISIGVTGGTSPYTYTWSNGAMGTSLANLAGGDYTVTVQDANNCIQTATYTVINPALVSANLLIENLDCFGDENGSITATPVGGTAPYYFAWSTGVFVQNLANLTAGNYTLTITDINGCFGVIQAAVTQPDQLQASHSANSYNGFGVSCYGSSDGIIDLTVTGGVAPYTYLWSTGATTQDISGLAAGEYSVGVIDANGCSISEGPQLPWNYVNTGINHTILIPAATINGVSLLPGDYIGVFFDQAGVLTCGGYVQWTGGQSAISAWGSEAETDNGFQNNEEFVWKVWRSADDEIIDMIPDYNAIAFPNTNAYVTNGLSGLNTLAGSGPSLQPNLGYFIEVTQPEPLTATGLVSDFNGYGVSCNGGNNGSISLNITTCLQDYDILWSNGATQASVSGLTAGNYSTTISYTVGEPIQSVPFNWTYTNTGANHTIFIPAATINGMPLEIGDYIGVFYNNSGTLVCGGYSQWTGTQTAISAWGTESGTTNGFADNEEFTWKVYRVLDGQVVNMTPMYSPMFPNQANYQTNGISGLISLTGEATITTFTGEVILNFTLTQPESLVLTGIVSNNACFGGSIGSVVTTTTGGLAPYSYLWSNGSTSSEIINVANGNYSVTVTDANGCTYVKSFTITQPAALAATATITNVSCNGGLNGAISATVTGGLTPYIYNWSNGATDAAMNGLAAGTYQLQVTDANLCTFTTSFVVTEPAALNLVTSATNVTCFGTSTGSVSTTVSGGTAPYVYSWSTGAVTANLTNRPIGTYSVTVTDAKGCSAVSSQTITQPDALAATETVSNVTCFGSSNGSISLNVTGGTTPYVYTWSTNATTSSISNIPANAYYVTVVDANGCSVNKQIFVNQPTKLTSDAVVTNISCFGANNGAVNLTVAGGVTPYSFMWSTGQTTEDISGLSAGPKSVIITDANGCAGTKSVTIAEPAALNVVSQVANVSCNGGNNGGVNITVYGGTTPYVYNWSNGATTQDLTNLTVGNYNVTVTDAKGCHQYGNYTVTQPAAMNVTYQTSSYGQYNVSAYGATDGFIILNVTGGTFPYFYNWNNGATTYYRIYVGAGNYSVTVTDLNGCSQVVSMTLTSAPAYVPMALTLTPSNYTGFGVSCYGSANGTAAVSVSNGQAPYHYAWSTGAATASIANLVAGTYTVTVTDATNATASQSVTITSPTEVVASGVATSPLCYGGNNGSINLTVSGGSSPYTYLWTGGATTQNRTGITAGNYTVTVTDSRGCQDVAVVAVTNPTQIAVQYSVTNPVCGADGTVLADASNGLAPYTYTWSTSATGSSLANVAGGVYGLTVSDANGCSAASSVTVTAANPVTAVPMITNVSCNGGSNGSISLVIDGGVSPYDVLWNNASTNQTITNLLPGTYSVVVTDMNGCSASYNYSITEPAALAASSVLTHVSCYDEEDGAIDLTVTGGVAPYLYAWSDGASSADRANLMSGNYQVTITDANNCTLVYPVTITQPDQIALTSTITNLSCFKSNDGVIDVTIAGGVSPYTYYWTNGTTTQDLHNAKAGQYSLIVIDANGCTLQSGSFTVTQPNALVAQITLGSNIGCSGSANGSLNTVVTGGTAPYTYLWSNNAITSSISNLSGGTYGLTVVDANGCQTTGSYTLIEPNSFSGYIYSGNVGCYGGNDGVAEAVALGGSYPFAFLWSTGATNESISNLAAGTYTVTITDGNNCTAVTTTTITQPTQLSVTFTTFAQSATPGSPAIVMANVTGGTGPYTYLWNNAVTTSYIKYVYVGNTVNLVVTDAHGCQVNINYLITPGSVVNPSVESEFYAFLSQASLEVKDMNIYPNPSHNGNFFIEFNGYNVDDMTIQLYDAYGRLVNDYMMNNLGQNIVEIKMNQYASGVYMVRFIDEFNQVVTKRVVLSE